MILDRLDPFLVRRGGGVLLRDAASARPTRRFQDGLGVRLLLRSTHGLTTTAAGRNCYERAKRAIEEAEEAELAADCQVERG
jgi:DNA-binding transcriptional LysR family regulator